MASSGALTCLAKRDLLASDKASPDKLTSQARICLETGRDYDALAFLAAAKETAEVERMGREAVERGDLFIHLQALRELGREPDPKDLKNLAEAARKRGLDSFAALAEARTGTPDDSDESSADG